MENGPERSEPVSTPLGLGGFDSFRAARERFFSTLTEASIIARLEAAWDGSENDGTTDGRAGATPEVS